MGKLAVAPCWLPSLTAGPYWVLAFDDSEGYALISGGAPTKVAAGGCQTGSGINKAGLWVFTRQQTRNEALVQKIRGIASSKGFDLSVLNDVDNTACTTADFQNFLSMVQASNSQHADASLIAEDVV